MAFGTAVFAAGAYTAKYGASGSEVTLGLLEGSPRQHMVAHAQDVRASQYGDSVIDGVYRGADCFVILTLKEWIASTKSAMWPFADHGLSGIHGRMMTELAKSLKFTAITGTEAQQNAAPATRTYPSAIYLPEFTKEVTFGCEERNVLMTFRCYPAEVTPGEATLRFFTDT